MILYPSLNPKSDYVHKLRSTLLMPYISISPVPGPAYSCLLYYMYKYIFFEVGWIRRVGLAQGPASLSGVRLDWAHVMMALCPLWVTEFRDAGSLTPPGHVMYRRHGQVESSGVMLWYGASMEVAIVPVR